MSAKLMKLVSGEYVIAEVSNETAETITLKETLKVVTVFQNDKMGVRFEPLNPFAAGPKEEITINKTMIMFDVNSPDLISEYNRITSGIVTAKVVPNTKEPKLTLAKH